MDGHEHGFYERQLVGFWNALSGNHFSSASSRNRHNRLTISPKTYDRGWKGKPMSSILTRKVHGNCTNSSPMFSRGILTLVVRMWECQSHTSRQQSRSMTQSTAWALSYRHHGSPSCLKKCFCLGLGAGLCETDKGSLLTQHTSSHLLCVHVLTALLEIGRVGNLSPMMHKK